MNVRKAAIIGILPLFIFNCNQTKTPNRSNNTVKAPVRQSLAPAKSMQTALVAKNQKRDPFPGCGQHGNFT
jgi:hypothetical protein